MVYYVIPARAGSKRFPHKNRKLLKFTLDSLPKKVHKRVVVTTDDPWIWDELEDYSVKLIKRDPELASDDASIRDVLLDVVDKFRFEPSDDLVLLYLTYPGRTYEETREALKFYQRNDARSLLCREEPKSHPYLCLFERDDYKGEQIVKHDEYRSQDYPTVFELSHYISVVNVGELERLNRNLYNEDTIYFPIDRVVDVDHPEDLDRFEKIREET